MTSPASIVRCILRDIGNPEAGACYARRIALGLQFNPYAEPGDADNYREAAERLEAIAAERKAEAEPR